MRTDTELLDLIIDHVASGKWDDHFPGLRPRDFDGEPLEKYINPKTFREMLERALMFK